MAEHRNHRPTALVTDAERGSALAIIRSLGRRGWRVIAAASAPDAPGFRSRYAAARVVYPSPADDPRGAAAALLGAAREHGAALLIPVTDDVGLPLAAARAQLADVCRVALADDEQIALVTDKQRTLALAGELGVPVPLTRQVRSAAEAGAVAGDFGWPVVVKPQVSRLVDEDSGVDVLEVTYAADRAGLLRVVGQFEGRCPVLLQEYCPGEGHGVELLAYEGLPLAAFQHQRLHEVPITGGASALRQSVALDSQLYEYARRLVAALKWTGLIMVEFKVGARGPRLMEINGRIWGSLPLAVFSGMDFPARLADLLLNGPPSLPAAPDTNYRIGVKARNLEKDIVWLLAVLSGRRRHAFLPTPGRWAALAALPGLLDPRIRTDSFAWDDPRPALAELPQIARKLLRKRGKGRGAGQGNKIANDLPGPVSGSRTFPPSPDPFPHASGGQESAPAGFSPSPLLGERPGMGGYTRRAAAALANSAAFAGAVGLLEQLDGRRPNTLAVLTYHRVDEPGARPHLSPAQLSATPAAFAAQMRALAARWHVVSAQDVLDAVGGGAPLSPRSVLITFDDAYVDFAEHAWPALRQLGLPVTLFVPTAYPDHPERAFWWDRLYATLSDPAQEALDTPEGRLILGTPAERRRAFKRLREHVKALDHDAAMAWVGAVCGESGAPAQPTVLGWDALRDLAAQGVTLGAHTQTHPLINRVSLARARAEALGSLDDLRREAGDVLPIFAYPSGGVSAEVAAELGQAGFALAFTTERGINDLRRVDPLRLRRINVGAGTPLAALRAQMLPATASLAGALLR